MHRWEGRGVLDVGPQLLPLAEIVPLWQSHLAELVAHRAAALRNPPSTIYADRAAFEKALDELGPWLAPGISR